MPDLPLLITAPLHCQGLYTLRVGERALFDSGVRGTYFGRFTHLTLICPDSPETKPGFGAGVSYLSPRRRMSLIPVTPTPSRGSPPPEVVVLPSQEKLPPVSGR
jgi:hypothetical protein